jgi:hypothetical protein
VRTWTTPPDLLAGRAAGAGLLVWMGWIHLHLWNEGYKHLPSVGNLFLLNFVASVLVAVGVLVTPRRYLTIAAGAGALLAAGTLVSLAISINVGLLGFTDSYNAPFAHLSVWVEAAAAVVLAVTAVRSAPFLRLGSKAGA